MTVTMGRDSKLVESGKTGFDRLAEGQRRHNMASCLIVVSHRERIQLLQIPVQSTSSRTETVRPAAIWLGVSLRFLCSSTICFGVLNLSGSDISIL